MANVNTGVTTLGGKRADVYRGPSLDEQAKARGYESFAQMQSEDPSGASLVQRDTPEGSITQVAKNDDANKWFMGLRDYLLPAVLAGGGLSALGVGGSTLGTGLANGGMSVGGGAGAGVGGSTLGTVAAGGGAAKGILSKIASMAELAGPAIANATKASYNNTDVANDGAMERARLERTDAGLENNAYNSNVNAQQTFENMFVNRADLEQKQRDSARSASYRDSFAQNMPVSPNNPRPVTLSDGLKKTLSTQANTPVPFGATSRPLAEYTPYVPRTLSTPEQQQPGGAAQAGNILGPLLTTLGGFGTPTAQQVPATLQSQRSPATRLPNGRTLQLPEPQPSLWPVDSGVIY